MASEDIVLEKMRELKVPLTLKNYLDLAFLGATPTGIEQDAEFMTDVPEIILRKRRSKKRR
jgi:hypothetical protein